MTVESLSYGLAAVAGLFAAAFALRGRVPLKAGITLACVLSVVWAGLLAALPLWPELQRTVWPYVAELARVIAWQAVLIALIWRDVVHEKSSRWGIAALLGVGGLLWLLATVSIAAPTAGPFGPLLAFLVVAVFGLVVLEHSYRHAGNDERWRFKFAWLGLGTVFGFDLFLYSEAALFGSLNPNVWAARGMVSAVASGFIAASLARVGRHFETVNLSRRFLFQSTALLGAGGYLLFISAAGYYIQHFGGNWAGALGAAFVACALLFLGGVLISGQFRARLNVLLAKHFFRYKYDYREAWQHFNAVLADNTTASTAPRERAIRALADLVDSPAGLVWSAGTHGVYHLAATWNVGSLGLLPVSAGHPMVRLLGEREWIIDVDEVQSTPARYDGLEWPTWWEQIKRPWLVLPLAERDGLRGFVVLAQPRSPRDLNWEDRDLLRTASRQVAGYVALADASEALVSSRQFDAFNRLSAYLVHDLKNVSAQLGLVTSNAARHRTNPAFIDDALQTVDNAKQRMDRLLDQLRRAEPVPEQPVQPCDLAQVLRAAAASCADRAPVPMLDLKPGDYLISANPGRLSMAIINLVHNAQEASHRGGVVRASLASDGRYAHLTVGDQGCGMDDTFLRERLFRPFATTKGNAGMGIGMHETRDYVESLGGMLEVVSEPGVGTQVTVTLPLMVDPGVAADGLPGQVSHVANG
ncbi:MAG: XrtA/PEP-CTERM system histidine kinase PrsK [Pseudomonadota bacterium]